MQDSDTNTQETEFEAEPNMRLAQVKAMGRLTLKRLVAVICFGPGVLGFLWLISRILRR
jgi:hypothetical protein